MRSLVSLRRCRLPAGLARDLFPPARQRRRTAREGERRELQECALIHAALEVNDLPHRVPEARPSPLVEFRLLRALEVEPHRLLPQPQQKPALLLADAERLLIPAHV